MGVRTPTASTVFVSGLSILLRQLGSWSESESLWLGILWFMVVVIKQIKGEKVVKCLSATLVCVLCVSTTLSSL